VRNGAEGRELATAHWGMPSSQHALMEATKKRAAKLEAKGKRELRVYGCKPKNNGPNRQDQEHSITRTSSAKTGDRVTVTLYLLSLLRLRAVRSV